MAINHVLIKDFGPFADLDLRFSPGLNVILGDSGTGKTFLLKLLYAACQSDGFERTLADVFGLEQTCLSRLVRHGQHSAEIQIEYSGGTVLKSIIPAEGNPTVAGESKRQRSRLGATYIPVDSTLAHKQAVLPPSKTAVLYFEGLLAELEDHLGGEIVIEGGRFYLKTKEARIEFELVSENVRRLALLWLLICNGCAQPGSVLFWDTPETGLNHRFEHIVADTLTELAADGVQVFVATHSMFLLREFEIQTSNWLCTVHYTNLYSTKNGIQVAQSDSPAEIGLITALEESLLQSDRYMEL